MGRLCLREGLAAVLAVVCLRAPAALSIDGRLNGLLGCRHLDLPGATTILGAATLTASRPGTEYDDQTFLVRHCP